MSEILNQLLHDVRQCKICDEYLPLNANPILQISSSAKILIAGQAPGLKVHKSGIPFDDKSGERLRQWLGVDSKTFYDENIFSILPMAFCYPGKGKSGDLPPRTECAEKWRGKLLRQLPNIELIIAIGIYAQNWHLPNKKDKNLTETVKDWSFFYDEMTPAIMPIPHPSPRNNIWLKKNPWFEQNVVPELQSCVQKLIHK